MQKQRLGSQGPDVSVVGFGAWEAGGGIWGDVPDDQTIEAMRVAVDAGITWIDTAEVYGNGRSEELVGRALQGLDALVFTKVAPQGAGTGFRPEQVKDAARKSLGRLQRDVIDLYQLHWPDPSIPVEDTWGAMADLVDEGLVRYIGVSNFDRELIERCEKIRHVDSLQPHFSMLHQAGRYRFFPFCKENGTGVIAYGPLAGSLLTGTITMETEFDDSDWRSGKTPGTAGYYQEFFAPGVKEKNLEKVERLKKVAERLGISMPQLALAWVFHQEGVTGAIAGSRSPSHVRDNAGAGTITLSANDLEEVDKILEG
ncbi:MAG: aldo/keto reductase [Actinobacteria bacterium]|nr:aldo/keto reductase [Actinomycetota bacterium]